nr:unnamed protein product [Callosobruchus analis]
MWLCDVCKSSYPTSESDKVDITVLMKEIECLKRELSSIEKLLENLEYTVTIQKSLLENNKGNGLTPSLPTLKSDVVDPNHHSKPVKKPVKNDSPVLIIKAPSELANTKNIMDEDTTSVNPGDLRVRFNTTRTIKNGVAVFCHDDQSLTTLKSNLVNKLGTNYTINEAKKLNPRLLIKNVNLRGLNTPQEILNDITSLNNFEESQKNDIKFVTKLKDGNACHIVIEVSPTLPTALLNEGSIFIGWKKSPVFDHLRVIKCIKCCMYGHTEKTCRSELTCPRCTRKHSLKECKSDALQCINCMNYNKTHKKNLPTDHSSNFKGCAVLQNYMDNLKQKVNYG